jgi:hypothetical protein
VRAVVSLIIFIIIVIITIIIGIQEQHLYGRIYKISDRDHIGRTILGES